jgi:hypothetical protein
LSEHGFKLNRITHEQNSLEEEGNTKSNTKKYQPPRMMGGAPMFKLM